MEKPSKDKKEPGKDQRASWEQGAKRQKRFNDEPRGRPNGQVDRTSRTQFDTPYARNAPRGRGKPFVKPGSRRGSASSHDLDRPQNKGRDRKAPTEDTRIHYDEIETRTFDPYESPETNDILKTAMGFHSFGSTKEKRVPGNEFNYGVDKIKVTQYRQYMNRVGGFNRTLSPTRGNRFAKPADLDGLES